MNEQMPQHFPTPDEKEKIEKIMSEPEIKLTELRGEMITEARGIDNLKEIYDGAEKLEFNNFVDEFHKEEDDFQKISGEINGHKVELIVQDISDKTEDQKKRNGSPFTQTESGFVFTGGSIDNASMSWDEGQKIVDKYFKLRGQIHKEKDLTKAANTRRSVESIL